MSRKDIELVDRLLDYQRALKQEGLVRIEFAHGFGDTLGEAADEIIRLRRKLFALESQNK